MSKNRFVNSEEFLKFKTLNSIIIAMKIDESRKTGKIIDLKKCWKKLDSKLKI